MECEIRSEQVEIRRRTGDKKESRRRTGDKKESRRRTGGKQEFLGILLVIILLQFAVTVMGYLFSEKVIQRTEKLMLKAVIGYREDLDLENVIDFIQKKQVELSSAQEEVFTSGCLEKIIWWTEQNLLLVGGLAGGLLLVEDPEGGGPEGGGPEQSSFSQTEEEGEQLAAYRRPVP
ncbi:hypothetical protein NHX12_033892 [Muraenolepis orangiensis]|uniref:Uncharacterized protein n=1 Tax=Muraenolepis orangiensis TaxID=630683 RepID=A0A9Q0E3I3_9TELE|nr:hypothetical protein NHX12_033892 [Muraenolepis orangiensis]